MNKKPIGVHGNIVLNHSISEMLVLYQEDFCQLARVRR